MPMERRSRLPGALGLSRSGTKRSVSLQQYRTAMGMPGMPEVHQGSPVSPMCPVVGTAHHVLRAGSRPPPSDRGPIGGTERKA